ncbi:bromodomain-containing protein 4-like [Cydia pomonella]|uniref:bromodomain-containing protein 4-like n=1 Tax=Cydia pomonella TaxID=82600 RepID=UPI002ADD90DC|nr:bromodomain-containing protein 4-like [Cydia pomonella]
MGSEGPPHSVPDWFSRQPAAMRFTVIAVLCACVVLAAGDGLRTKAKLLGKLAAKIKHHKRGVFTAAPPYKYGHDIPHVTHSIVKPIVVSYPPTASVHSVKVPLKHPLIHHYPVQVGHKIPLHSHSYAHRFPHTNLRPDQHFHHHHHHVAPRPVVPILPAHAVPAAPVVPTLPVPIPQPSVVIPRPIPAPSPPVAPIIPATPQFILPQNHVHLKPALSAPVPIQPAPVASLYPYAPQYSYAVRPGNAVQTSYFATYPRYPLSFHQPLVPFAQPAVPAPAVHLAPSVAPAAGPIFLDRPQEPHFHVLPQAHAHGVVEQPTPAVAVEHHQFLHPTAVPQPTLLHAHPTVIQEHPGVHEHPTVLHQHPTVLQAAQPTVHVDHNGWAPVPHSHDINHVHQEGHFHQDLVPTQETHFGHDFTQEQGQQVFEHHTGEEQYHEYQHQLQHHIQQQIEQAQYEQNLHNHQLGQPEYPQNHDFSQGHDVSQGHDFSQHGHDFSQYSHDFSQHGQDFSQHAGHDFSQHGHDFSQGQDFSQHHEFSQHGQDFSHTQEQPNQEYGVPQQLEGRSEEGEEPQKFHNHIPLGLQPPLDRPLEHFR